MTTIVAEDPGAAHWFTRIAQQLSIVTVIIIIAGGLLTCLLLFIFAKRQIMRFALRSHRGPHVPFGTDANKALRKEIMRRIEALPKITYEPKMLREDESEFDSMDEGNQAGKVKPCHYYRMKAMDKTKSLEQSLIIRKLGKRQSFESLRSYLMLMFTPQVDPRIIHQFCDLYEAARFNPKSFWEDEYKVFTQLLKQLRTAVSTLQPKANRSPAKSSASVSLSKSAAATALQDDSFSKNAPYMRRSSKESRRGRWSFQRSQTEEQALCESAASPPHDIITSGKTASTVV